MDTNYKLVNSVDPTKCRTKVREKFAKLTLSSNKKKQEDAELQQQQMRERSVQSNVSRNLLSELITDDESEGETEQRQIVNLITRTDSSPSEANVEPQKESLNYTDTTHCSEADNKLDKSMEMEPLLVSEIENTDGPPNFDEEIEKLSSRVSSLAVEIHPPMPTISPEISRIISTENQKMDSGQRLPDVLKVKCKKEPDVSICITSSSNEDDSAITILDSSEEENEDYIHNVSPAVTVNPQIIPDTVKADRMAAFLRDVRRNYGLPVYTPERELDEKQREMATADTEPLTGESDSRSGVDTERALARADTESMTEHEGEVENETLSMSRNRKLAMDDTEDNTRTSEALQSPPHYVPVIKINPQLLDESVQISDSSIPDDSVTIAETTEEEIHESSEASHPETQRELQRSESPTELTSKESSASCGQDSQIQINFSAKISIQIQVSQHMEESTSSGSVTTSDPHDASERNSNSSKTHSSAQKAQNTSKAVEDIPHSPPELDVPMESPKIINKSPDNFMHDAQRLLNELYGETWKTPEVMRTLKKTTAKTKTPLTVPKPADSHLEPKDESALDDFSIFRRNIPQDLDSTRLPITPLCAFKVPKPAATVTKSSSRQLKANHTEKSPQFEITKTKSGREVRQRWRAIVDSDTESEGDNASDDKSKSWTKSDSEEDYIEENKPIIRNTKRTKSKPNAKNKSGGEQAYLGEAEKEEFKENIPFVRPTKRVKPKRNAKNKSGNELVYLDLSKDEIEVQHDVSISPPANHDEKFDRRLEEILKNCQYEEKPKLECTPGGRTKRKLFTANLNDDEETAAVRLDSPKQVLNEIDADNETVSISGVPMPAKFEPFNKYLESVKTGKPIFKIQTPKPKSERKVNPTEISSPVTPKSSFSDQRVIENLSATPKDKYGFLKSLDVCVSKYLCHPDALHYRDNFRVKKSELADKLYVIYNTKLFDERLNVPLQWNKKLTNTAGRCMNKKKMGERTCVVELSEKVLTSADRLRCTLIHELCHAATWIFNGEGGHGSTWKSWAAKANQIFPELPKIGVCHQYDIEYKYTYKCTLCGAKSNAHSKSKKVENIRCSYCHGAIEVFLNKKDKDGNIMATPVREPTGFAKFVKDKYKEYKKPDLKHADVMKLLSNEFASLKVGGKS